MVECVFVGLAVLEFDFLFGDALLELANFIAQRVLIDVHDISYGFSKAGRDGPIFIPVDFSIIRIMWHPICPFR